MDGRGLSGAPGCVHALFQQRVDGDEALLRLAGLRFAQMGTAAEVYADTPDQLEHVLRFVPPHPRLPVVHLSRGVNVLHGRDRALVREFADRFAAASPASSSMTSVRWGHRRTVCSPGCVS